MPGTSALMAIAPTMAATNLIPLAAVLIVLPLVSSPRRLSEGSPAAVQPSVTVRSPPASAHTSADALDLGYVLARTSLYSTLCAPRRVMLGCWAHLLDGRLARGEISAE